MSLEVHPPSRVGVSTEYPLGFKAKWSHPVHIWISLISRVPFTCFQEVLLILIGTSVVSSILGT